ncbi:MAG: prepilin-type N-terminal cleavage/methylation domain-containing protein [Desulfobacterales bacterium]|nr:prepilin-type N-terminal cleavage/methylation domain-containing protein [Desulfobacterales bacterium]
MPLRLQHRTVAPACPRYQGQSDQARDICTGDSQSSRAHLTRSDGFTLLELIVVILLLTILLGFAIPAFQTGGAAGSKDRVARELLHAVKKLKIAALNRQSIHRLHLGLDENRIWVSRGDRNSDPASSRQSERALPDDVRIEHVRFAGREEIRSGVAAIAFYPQGHSDRAVIRLSDGGSKPIDLIVEAFLPMALIVSDNGSATF